MEISNTTHSHIEEMDSRNLCLVFDTETNGLWPRDTDVDINNYPYIVQLSFVLYDINKNAIVKTFNKYIKPAAELDYSGTAFKITKITKEMCDNGISVAEALEEFYSCYVVAGTIVAHNIDFDRKMIQLEVLRNHHILSKKIDGIHVMFNTVFNDVFKIRTFCSMTMGRDITNIIMTGKDGRQWKKNPKLSELYEKIFDKKAENLHDSMVDTLLCLQCFAKMKYNAVVNM